MLSKNVHQKHSAWVPGDPFYACEGQKKLLRADPGVYLNIVVALGFAKFVETPMKNFRKSPGCAGATLP